MADNSSKNSFLFLLLFNNLQVQCEHFFFLPQPNRALNLTRLLKTPRFSVTVTLWHDMELGKGYLGLAEGGVVCVSGWGGCVGTSSNCRPRKEIFFYLYVVMGSVRPENEEWGLRGYWVSKRQDLGKDPTPHASLTVEHATEETNINFENGNFCTH